MSYLIHLLVCLAGALGDKLPLGYQSPAIPVQEVSGFLEPHQFWTDHVIPGQPVIFRGAIRDYPAYLNWSDQYFLDQPESKEWMITYELGKKEKRDGGMEYVSFADYVSRYKDEDLYCVTGLPRFLRRDLPVFEPLNCNFVTDSLMDDLVMWFSSGGTKSVWHTDDYENLNCLIRVYVHFSGKKELILGSRSEMELGHLEGGYSRVDVDEVDLDKYPGFAEMMFYNATIEQGDCIYIPVFWSHVVRSWGRNIAINAWWEIYRTPLRCLPSEHKTWETVTLTSDSDMGRRGDEEDPETELGRTLAGEIRTNIWASEQMRKHDVISADNFMETLITEMDEDNEEVWRGVFAKLDLNGDGLLQPREVDLLTDDAILLTVTHLDSVPNHSHASSDEL